MQNLACTQHSGVTPLPTCPQTWGNAEHPVPPHARPCTAEGSSLNPLEAVLSPSLRKGWEAVSAALTHLIFCGLNAGATPFLTRRQSWLPVFAVNRFGCPLSLVICSVACHHRCLKVVTEFCPRGGKHPHKILAHKTNALVQTAWNCNINVAVATFRLLSQLAVRGQHARLSQ